MNRQEEGMRLLPTSITAAQIEEGDTIIRQTNAGPHRLVVSSVVKEDSGLIRIEGVGSFDNIYANAGTPRLYAYGPDDKVTVLR